MKQALALALFIGLAATGCKKKEADSGAGAGTAAKPTSGPTRKMGLQTNDDCDRLGKKTSADSMAMTPPGTPDDQKAKLQAISDEAGNAIAALCKSDSWSGEAIACGLSAKDPSKECDGKLTPAQKTNLETTVKAIFAKGMAAMGSGDPSMQGAPPPTTEAPAGGSAVAPPAGSAAAPAGSAAPATP